jgi:hypothetical protein
MATTFNKKTPVIQQGNGSGSTNIVNNVNTPRNVPSANGSRIEPKDSYIFVRNSTAIFKATFHDTDKPVQVDVATAPVAIIRRNGFQVADPIQGELVPGQLYEYMFQWEVANTIDIAGVYTIEYRGILGGIEYVWGAEYFQVSPSPQNIKLKEPAYATVDQLRLDKFNIDSYLPKSLAQDKAARDEILHHYLITATKDLNGQLNLRDFHSSYNDNFNLYTRQYAIWLILRQAMGEEGSAVSDRSLTVWEQSWKKTLKQIKMHSQLSNIPVGRA